MLAQNTLQARKWYQIRAEHVIGPLLPTSKERLYRVHFLVYTSIIQVFNYRSWLHNAYSEGAWEKRYFFCYILYWFWYQPAFPNFRKTKNKFMAFVWVHFAFWKKQRRVKTKSCKFGTNTFKIWNVRCSIAKMTAVKGISLFGFKTILTDFVEK